MDGGSGHIYVSVSGSVLKITVANIYSIPDTSEEKKVADDGDRAEGHGIHGLIDTPKGENTPAAIGIPKGGKIRSSLSSHDAFIRVDFYSKSVSCKSHER